MYVLKSPLALIFIVCLLASLAIAWLGWGVEVQPHQTWPMVKLVQAGVAIFWIVAPPVWFWIEYFYVNWSNYLSWKGKSDAEKFERFKYGQDISSKIWLAVSTSLLMLYFGKDLHL